MAIDITGGYHPSQDYILPEKPGSPEIRESVSMWISDDLGRFGIPRVAIEAWAEQWNHRGVQVNIAFPDGRVLMGANGYDSASPKIINGLATTLNAGPLTFELVEPLKRWNMIFDGTAYETTVQRQIAGEMSGPLRRVRIRVETTAAIPPWSPGEHPADPDVALCIGAVSGRRHEQLFRCTGTFHIEGEPELTFSGTGLRIHRIGDRQLGTFPGHCWQSAVFPSGKAFCVLVFPPAADGKPWDGKPAFEEAYLFDGQRVSTAKVVSVPWMTEFIPHGGPVDVVLETGHGERVRIAGKTHDSTFTCENRRFFGNYTEMGEGYCLPIPVHQGGALYTWDGESAYGMVERSLPRSRWK